MNPETGRIYRTPEEIEAARKRGEPLVGITPSFNRHNNEFRDAMKGSRLNLRSKRNRKPVKR